MAGGGDALVLEKLEGGSSSWLSSFVLASTVVNLVLLTIGAGNATVWQFLTLEHPGKGRSG